MGRHHAHAALPTERGGRLPLTLEQQAIEEDQGGRRFPGKAIDAALRRMQPHLQRIERHLAIDRNDEFAVKHERRVRERA